MDDGNRIAAMGRRSFLRRSGAAAAGSVTAASLAGCSIPGADHASYWSESGQVDADYDAVLEAASDASYDVEAPYYVGSRNAAGLAPDGRPDLESRFGPGYRVFGFSFYHAPQVLLEVWLTDDPPTATLIDDRGVGEFPVASVPPEAWLVDRLTLAFDVDETDAREYAADLRKRATEGTSTPTVGVDAPVRFEAVYEAITEDGAEISGSSTGGDGWYTETATRDGQRIATVDFVVQSAEIRRSDGDRTYVLKIDRLGGFYLHVTLPVGEELPEEEYRGVFRELFSDVGLPPEAVDALAFEYAPSIG
jgi:hypothetical protein